MIMLLVFPILASCSDEQSSRRQALSAASWGASGEMILRAQLDGLVPKGFSDLAIERCEEQISSTEVAIRAERPDASTLAYIVKLRQVIGAARESIALSRQQIDSIHILRTRLADEARR